MQKNDNEQYKLGAEEKEILQKISIVEASVLRNNQQNNQRELVSTKYYSEFIINTNNGPVTFNNVFITAERNKEGEMSYHFRWIMENEKGEQTIEENLTVDENGNIYMSEGLKSYLGNAKLDIDEIISENDSEKGRLKGVSEKSEGKEKSVDDEAEEEEQEGENQKIEKDLEEQGEDLKITKYRKIKDGHISERMPDVFEEGTENGVAFSNKINTFVIISKVNNQYQINENVEPVQMTWKTIISIDPSGEKIEKKVPHALMKTNKDDKEIAVTIGDYGIVDIETVDVLPCQERIAREVRSEGQDLNEEESFEMRQQFNAGGKEYKHDLAHQVKEIEEAQKDENQTIDYNITKSDLIPGTDMTWGTLMEDTGESLTELIERFDRETIERNKTPEQAIEDIEEDYGNVQHEHKR